MSTKEPATIKARFDIGDRIITNNHKSMITELHNQKGRITELKPIDSHWNKERFKYTVKLDKPVNNGMTDIHNVGLEIYMFEGI